MATLMISCGQSEWPERGTAIVQGVRVDSLKFFPAAGRFILSDSTTSIRFHGFHKGYKCSEVLEAGLARLPENPLAVYGPVSKIRLPATPDCPLETSSQNLDISHIFHLELDTVIRLANSAGVVTASAKLVQGRLAMDSLIGIPDGVAATISKGKWLYLDSNSQNPRRLSGDSLSSCEYLNQATYTLKKDSIQIHFSWLILDSASAPDTCHGELHQDEIVVESTTP